MSVEKRTAASLPSHATCIEISLPHGCNRIYTMWLLFLPLTLDLHGECRGTRLLLPAPPGATSVGAAVPPTGLKLTFGNAATPRRAAPMLVEGMSGAERTCACLAR